MNKLIALLCVIAISCTENGVNNNKQISDKSTVETSQNKINQGEIKIFDFDKYWIELGRSIKCNDTNKLKMLIQCPLKIYGRYEAEPQLNINSNEIIKAFMFAINNGGYYDPDKDASISNKELLLSNLKEIKEYNQSSESQCISDFLFKKTNKGWKLIILHMNTNEYLKNKSK